MRYRFESSSQRNSRKVPAGVVHPKVLFLIVAPPAVASLLVLVLLVSAAPHPAPKATLLALATPAVLAQIEGAAEVPATSTPASASQPRTAIVAQPQANEDSVVPQAGPTDVPDDDHFTRCADRKTRSNLWCVEFFADRDQIGDPKWVEIVSKLNYSFGRGSPRPNVPNDNFKIVATGNFDMPRLDSYVYDLTVDGGARLWIDNQLTIDEWYMWNRRTKRVRVPLLQATHLLRVEYYDNRGAALLQLLPSIKHDMHHNWLGRYYNSSNLEGLPAMIREDENVKFVWPLNPGQPVNNDNFSVQWVRILDVPGSGFECVLLADDAARLYVDGRLVEELNSWNAPNTGPKTVKLNAGRRFVELHYAEYAGEARIDFHCDVVNPAPY